VTALPDSTLLQELLPLREAAQHAGVHPCTVRRWVAAGRLTGYRIGPRLVKVDMRELDRLIEPITGGAG